MSEAYQSIQPQAPASPHPIALTLNDDLRRSRLTVFFRFALAIPHLIWAELWGIVASFALVIAWFAALILGRVPDGLHTFLAGYVRYVTRVNGYLLLLANPWPPFTGDQSYPIDVMIAPAAPQSRLTVFFRILMAIPALILSYVFRLVNNVVAFLSWFYALIFGRMNQGMENTSAWLYRYEVQTYGYLFLLTGKYPSLSGGPTL